MLRRLIGASLLLGLVALVPGLLEAQAPDKKKTPSQDAPPKDSGKLAAGQFVGKLKSTPGSDRTFTLTIENKKLVPGGKGGRPGNVNNQVNRVLQTQNQIARAQIRVQTARSPQQRIQAMQQMQRAQLQLQRAVAQMNNGGSRAGGGAPPGYSWATTAQDIEFQVMEGVKVRTTAEPEAFDDKGNIKKYTKKELADLKGKDRNLVGFESSVDKLEPGQMVQVTLAPAPQSEQNKDKDKDPDEADKKMQVRLIVILGDAPAPSSSNAGKGKGKK